MSSLRFITLEEAIAMHFDQIERYGGSHGIRNKQLLESAIASPQAKYAGFYLYETPFKMLLHTYMAS